ncbi:MAG TPA: hypothetical protein VGE75_03580 [Acidimicrobiales bacterium]
MPAPKKTWFTILGVVATGLTTLGIVLAATDPNPSGIAKDPLALNGYPPKTAKLAISIETGSAITIHALVDVNFTTNKIEATLVVPLVLAGIPVDVRFVGDQIYASTPNFASTIGKPWIALQGNLPPLFNYSLELVKPDISLISGFPSEAVTRNGYNVTHDFRRDNVAVTQLGALSSNLPKVGSLNWSITTGKQGEVTSSTLTVSTRHSFTTLSATVLSYNQPTRIVAPPKDQVKVESSAYLRGLLGSGMFSVLIPANLSNLGSTSLS